MRPEVPFDQWTQRLNQLLQAGDREGAATYLRAAFGMSADQARANVQRQIERGLQPVVAVPSPVAPAGTHTSDILSQITKPETIQAPVFQAQTPATRDLSWLREAFQQYGQQRANVPQYQPTDLTALQQQVGDYVGQANQPVFGLQGLQDLIGRLAGMQAPQARYQTPEQVMQLQQQTLQQFQPLVDVQTQQAQAAYNEMLARITAQRAAQGLLGGPATERMMADQARAFGQDVAGIHAVAQANALQQALVLAELGLREQGQLFGQDLAAGQAAAGAYGQGLGMQEQMRQFGIGALGDLANMAEAQRQFAAQHGLSVEQLQQQMRQFGLSGLQEYANLAGQQDRWVQEMQAQSLRDQFTQWAQTQNMNLQQQQAHLENLLEGTRLAQDQRQFDAEMPLRVAQLTGMFEGERTLAGRQFDWGRDMDLAALTGMLKGQRTLAGREFDWRQQADRAGFTGMFEGERTLAGRQFDMEEERLRQEMDQAGLGQIGPLVAQGIRDAAKLYDEARNNPAEQASILAESLRGIELQGNLLGVPRKTIDGLKTAAETYIRGTAALYRRPGLFENWGGGMGGADIDPLVSPPFAFDHVGMPAMYVPTVRRRLAPEQNREERQMRAAEITAEDPVAQAWLRQMEETDRRRAEAAARAAEEAAQFTPFQQWLNTPIFPAIGDWFRRALGRGR